MEMKPPAIVIKGNWYDIWCDANLTKTSTLYGLVQGLWRDAIVYDSSGAKWILTDMVPERQFGPLARFLSRLFYNPRFKAEAKIKPGGRFEMEHLKREVTRLIDEDDDILSQFLTKEELRAGVANASTVPEIIHIFNKGTGIEQIVGVDGQ